MKRPADWEKEEERLAAASLAAHDPTGWFDQLYAAGASGQVQMPWSRIEPHPLLTGWVQDRNLTGRSRTSAVTSRTLDPGKRWLASRIAVSDTSKPPMVSNRRLARYSASAPSPHPTTTA
jgi:hypothetical protein